MKILAIDIGSFQVKAAIIETKFKRFDVVLHDCIPVTDAWQAPQDNVSILSPGQVNALAEIQRRYASSVNRVVSNLPHSLYSSRFMTFPLKDKRKVHAAIKFAVEDEIPFDLNDCILTSHLFPLKKKAKETHVLTGFAPLKPLEEFVDVLGQLHLHVDNLMMEDSALCSMFQRQKQAADRTQNFAVLNLGHRKSGIFFFRDSLPVMHRTTMTGGYQVTHAIGAKYNVPVADAESAKIERAFLALPDMKLTKEQGEFSDIVRGALEPVFSDFQQSLMAFTSRFNEPLSQIYVCGGTSLIPGLAEYLSARWQIKLAPLSLTHLFPNFSIQPQKHNEALIPTAAALGLSQVPGDQKSHINFRSGKLYSGARGLQLNFRQFIYPAKLAFSIYTVAMISLIGQMYFLRADFDRKDAALTKSLQIALGGSSNSFINSLKNSPTKLKQTLQRKVDEFKTEGEKGAKPGAVAMIDLIQDLSKSVPKSTNMEIKQFEYTQNQVTLRVESATQADAEAAISTISKLRPFQSPKASAIEPKGAKKKFTLTVNLPVTKGM